MPARSPDFRYHVGRPVLAFENRIALVSSLGAAFLNMPSEWKHMLTPLYRASGLPAGYVLEKCAPLQSMLASYFSEWRKPFEEAEEVFVEAEEPFAPTPET